MCVSKDRILSYFSIALIKHCEQDNLQKKEFIGGLQLLVGIVVADKQA